MRPGRRERTAVAATEERPVGGTGEDGCFFVSAPPGRYELTAYYLDEVTDPITVTIEAGKSTLASPFVDGVPEQ